LALGAVADPTPVKRQLTTIQGVISSISSNVATLDTAVQGYKGGDASSLLTQSDSLLSGVQSGTKTVTGSGDLSQNDALSLTSPVQALQSAIQGLVTDLNSKKCDFVAAGSADKVLSNLQQQKTASQALADAITSKVPQALQSIATQLSSGIATALQTGITDFQDTSSCPKGGSSSASGSSSVAPTSTGSGGSVSTTTSSTNGTISTHTASSSPATQTTNAAMAVNAFGGYAGAVAIAAMVGAAF
jgi:hypothetical protein